MKKTILALMAAAALIGGAATMAEAKTNFTLHLGVPYYDYQVGPDYRYNRSYGWYRPNYDRGFRGRLSCNEARQAVRERGYRNVIALECSGRTYTFNATRNNKRIQLFVNSRTGAVFRG